MTIIDVRHMLLWSLAINYGVLLGWFALFAGAHEWMYRLHSHWFKLPAQTFDALNWAGIAVYKLGIILFVLVPLIAIWLTMP